MKANSQAFISYGDRGNKYLLVNYGFCFPENRYETFKFNVRTDIKSKSLTVKQVLKKTEDLKNCQAINFKRELLCEMLMTYLRHNLKTQFFGNTKKTVPIT